MPARRGRPAKGDRRIDAAIDHFTVMGYAARVIRAVVNDLLKLYGGPDAWHLLEDGSYSPTRLCKTGSSRSRKRRRRSRTSS